MQLVPSNAYLLDTIQAPERKHTDRESETERVLQKSESDEKTRTRDYCAKRRKAEVQWVYTQVGVVYEREREGS